MVAFKNVVALAAIALSSLVAAQAPPPACVLACVNEASSPSAYKEICETKVSTTWTCLKSSCSDAYDDASKHVQERCKAEGLTVDMKKAVPAKKEEKEDKEEDKKETGSSDKDDSKDDTTTEEEEDAADSGAGRIGGSFGALAIALTVMGAMSF